MRSLLRVVAVTLVIATMAASGSASEARPPADLTAGTEYSVVGALASLPAVSGYVHVGTTNLTAFSDALDVAAPTGVDDPALGEWVDELVSGHELPVPIPHLFNLARINAIAEWGPALGWAGFVDATAFVDLRAGGRLAELSITVITGDVGEHSFGPAVTPLRDGVFTLGSGQDGEPVPGNTIFDLEGRPIRMAAKDGLIAASLHTAPVLWWLAGPDPSLAEDDTMASIAGELDSNGAISAIIRRSSFVFDRFVPTDDYAATEADVAAAMERTLVTEEFSTVGLGWAPDSPTTIVYAFADADSATAAATQLETLYREGESYDGAELSQRVALDTIEVSDRLVVLTVSEQSPWELWTLFFNRETPFTFRPSS